MSPVVGSVPLLRGGVVDADEAPSPSASSSVVVTFSVECPDGDGASMVSDGFEPVTPASSPMAESSVGLVADSVVAPGNDELLSAVSERVVGGFSGPAEPPLAESDPPVEELVEVRASVPLVVLPTVSVACAKPDPLASAAPRPNVTAPAPSHRYGSRRGFTPCALCLRCDDALLFVRLRCLPAMKIPRPVKVLPAKLPERCQVYISRTMAMRRPRQACAAQFRVFVRVHRRTT